MGWLIALGILILLAILPLGVSVRYDSEGPVVRLILGFIRITLIPGKKKENNPKKEKKTEKTESVTSSLMKFKNLKAGKTHVKL